MDSVSQFGTLDYHVGLCALNVCWKTFMNIIYWLLRLDVVLTKSYWTNSENRKAWAAWKPHGRAAIHDGDLGFDPDASSCAILPYMGHSFSRQAWEPVHRELAPCLGLMLDQFHTRHAESSTSSETSSIVSMHLPKAQETAWPLCSSQSGTGSLAGTRANSESGGPGHRQLKASWPCVAIKPCLQHVPNWGWMVRFTLNIPNMHHADGRCSWHDNVAQTLALWVLPHLVRVVSCSAKHVPLGFRLSIRVWRPEGFYRLACGFYEQRTVGKCKPLVSFQNFYKA